MFDDPKLTMQNFVLPNNNFMYTKHWNLSTLYHIHPNTKALYTLQISLCYSPYIAIDLQPMQFVICDNPYLYICTIKPACLHNSVLGVVTCNRHGRSRAWFLALVTLPMSQDFADFLWTTTDRQTNYMYFIPCACAMNTVIQGCS